MKRERGQARKYFPRSIFPEPISARICAGARLPKTKSTLPKLMADRGMTLNASMQVSKLMSKIIKLETKRMAMA